MDKNWQKAAVSIKNGGVAVIPTDTIYGIVAAACDRKAVAGLYRLRRRNPPKPCIVLCSSMGDLPKLGIKIGGGDKMLLSKIWPNPVSVILPCPALLMKYLHRGTKSLAVRIPRPKKLRDFIRRTGPIIAPSANPEGKPPAKSIGEAKSYFGDKVDAYVKGKVSRKPSTLIKVADGKIEIIRQGTWKVFQKLTGGIQ
jgi:L-threonylcarbamoyladenylate synthase